MTAFIFTPGNGFVAKLPVYHRQQLQPDLEAFLEKAGDLPDHCYLEAFGETWTIVSQSPLKLAEGRVAAPPAQPKPMPTVTTEFLPGHLITGARGIVSGEAIMGASFLRDLAAGLRDFVGGRSAANEYSLSKGRAIALAEMIDEAKQAGAHAIVGVKFGYETVGSMFMICATGTAVTVKSDPASTIKIGHLG
jgi:uncharacterized protein YbjQ (UPF0145 family)